MTAAVQVAPSREIPIVAYSSNDDENNSPPEFVMIELNGELLAPVEFPTKHECTSVLGSSTQVELGKLSMQNDGIPVMILGSHQLKGSIEKLKQPFCLMEKQYNSHKELQSYQITGMVKQKYLFNSYPKVIMR